MIEPEIQDKYFCVWQKCLERIPWSLRSHHFVLPCLAYVEDLMLGFQMFYSFLKSFCISYVAVWKEIISALEKLVVFLFWFFEFVVGVFFKILTMCLYCMSVFSCTLIFGCLLLFLPLSTGIRNSPRKQLIYLLQGIFEKTLAKACF